MSSSVDDVVISPSLELLLDLSHVATALEWMNISGQRSMYTNLKEPAPKKLHKNLAFFATLTKKMIPVSQIVMQSHLILIKPSSRRWLRVLFLKIPVKIQPGGQKF